MNLPANGRHSLGVDRNGKVRVYANAQTDRRKLPHKKLGLRRNIHRKNYALIRNALQEKMPQIFQNQSILQHVTITNQEYVTKYKLRKDKIQVHPGIEHVLTSDGNNQGALTSIGDFVRVISNELRLCMKRSNAIVYRIENGKYQMMSKAHETALQAYEPKYPSYIALLLSFVS